MDLTFKATEEDEREQVAAWLAGKAWPYHGNQAPDLEAARELAAAADQTFWVLGPDGEAVGLIRLHDLEDPTPMFDLRVAEAHRCQGIGTAALRWLTDHVFSTMPDKIRIEGHTRQDNAAMRRVFRRCGYAKEAHHRQAWSAGGGEYLDAIGYGILREDWRQRKVTPVRWHDEEADDAVSPP